MNGIAGNGMRAPVKHSHLEATRRFGLVSWSNLHLTSLHFLTSVD